MSWGFVYQPDWGRNQSVPWFGSLSTDFVPRWQPSHRLCMLGQLFQLHWRSMHPCWAHWQYLAHCFNMQTNSSTWESSQSAAYKTPSWLEITDLTWNQQCQHQIHHQRESITNLFSLEPYLHIPIWVHTLMGFICRGKTSHFRLHTISESKQTGPPWAQKGRCQ